MKLYGNAASPFARKCRVIAHELGLKLEEIRTLPMQEPELAARLDPVQGGRNFPTRHAPGVGGDSLFLVTDAGVKFPVPSASAASALGYRAGRAIAMPASLLSLLPTGPALNLAPMRG